MTKKGSYYRLSNDTREKIKMIAQEKKMSHAEVIEHMVDKYFENRSEEYKALMKSIEELLNKVLDEKLETLKQDVKQIRVIANVIDRNTQMMLEFWNHYFIANEFKMFATTETYRAEELNIAEQLVKKRIAHNRQRKLDREKRNKDV